MDMDKITVAAVIVSAFFMAYAMKKVEEIVNG